ncbi:2-phospho-L-lactate guanylyltransferase [Planctomycetes bacterium CA13]|uniref:2-phospho-L-lactate guanylyltransferase n=1 Tax=Novipirellula herctigrandis TaxID=2527986 RepID=A0A5C5YP45_9BACT|nr:2-phospho-L-lactate guanylyltransferase [Planctomycetes bacterium CA13]
MNRIDSNRKNAPAHVQLVMLTKYWTPGRVKTRLGNAIGMQAAAKLHCEFTRYLHQTLETTGDDRSIAVTPDSSLARFENDLDTSSWNVTPQGDGDLGERMARQFRAYLNTAEQPSSVILIGTDCPLISEKEINFAAQCLHNQDIVIGPALDGGYYLIGLRSPWREAFDSLFREMQWGTCHVFETTKARASEACLSAAVLPLKEDVDTVDDLMRFRHHLSASGPSDPSRRAFADRIETLAAEFEI